MKERGILFNTDMAQAILDGRKTQTRRPVKKEIVDQIIWIGSSGDDENEFELLGLKHDKWRDDGVIQPAEWLLYNTEYLEEGVIPIGQQLGAVGDRLWVRETFCWGGYVKDHEDLLYRADCDYSLEERGDLPWTPSIHMPRWACRLVLEITNVRLERIQDITEADAKAEGTITEEMAANSGLDWRFGDRKQFQDMWDKVYPNSWDNNEWVWVIEFKIAELNGKKMEQAA
ncbi:hypothetical protein MSP8886_01393 [Marinomonas spartinae]|uniref:Morphogenetic protein n=1 Tax=Marinomonas spartinae TaxID=1792290 RepID=A0A1A8TB28_9GAMM|nr:hypothetical protein [Marinomonas spartinae]SBS28990.1 hypothetical protein MSP8886_01393 [Marinomonas spartinae]